MQNALVAHETEVTQFALSMLAGADHDVPL
jgi:hypothetical protein